MTKANIHLITGGQRSGKSAYAEKLALEAAAHPIYLATSKVWDKEHQERINQHKEGRSEAWQTIEEAINIGTVLPSNTVVLMDCVTLWLTNIFEACSYDKHKAKVMAIQELDQCFAQKNHLFIVSAELGMGIIPMEASSRSFLDVHGLVNQYIAQKATAMTFMVSGLPLKIK